MKGIIILPNQLFENNDIIDDHHIFIYEDPVYFTLFKFHKLKLILHRATMKAYEDYLKKEFKNNKVTYVEYNDNLRSMLKKYKIDKIDMYNPVDYEVEKKLNKLSQSITYFETPLFLLSTEEINKMKNKKKFTHHSFYTWQRKRLNILMNGNKPIKGKWSFDSENREPFPKNFSTDVKIKVNNNKYVKDAIKYINKNFKKNPGSDKFFYEIDHKGAKNIFKNFLLKRMKCFGKYQDAVSDKINFGCHSVISPYLNIGLLTPQYIVNETLKYFKKNRSQIQSVEGFLRQVIGWREYVMMLYVTKRKELMNLNFFKHRKRIPNNWYSNKPKTGFHIIDHLIIKAYNTAYQHHIERLMYMGNFMLLTETFPSDVFEWFMVMFIDSYNWVMLPNVHGMSQFSSKNLMMTRPYFSSSAYIDRMSNFNKKKNKYDLIKIGKEEYEWFDVWDALYYNFISRNKKYLKTNYATSRSVYHWDNKSKNEQKELVKIAKKYMKKY